MPQHEGYDTFEGDPERSQQRIRELVEEACRVLPARRLNLISYHIAARIDSEMGQLRCRTEILADELNSEVMDMQRALRALGKELAK
jgi:hypothetical protein